MRVSIALHPPGLARLAMRRQRAPDQPFELEGERAN
jgi:hypothetical protein